MPKRFALLIVLFLVVGFATRAFGAQPSTINRAGAVALLVEARPDLKQRADALRTHMPPLPLFDDVSQSQWYASYVEAAFEKGVIGGNMNRIFRPSALLTNEEALVLVVRFKQIGGSVLPVSANSGDWLSTAMANAQTLGITVPPSLGQGRPIDRQTFYGMMTSAGVAQPQSLVVKAPAAPVQLVKLPTPAPVVQRQPTTTAQQVAQIYRAPVAQAATAPAVQRVTQTAPAAATVQRVAQATTAAPAPSAKSFAITMPSLGIKDLSITHPSDPFSAAGLLAPLKYGVGHLFSYPGKGGKILIYGHSSSYPWDVSSFTKIFRQINKLNVGDKIYVTYGGTVHTYQVSYKNSVPAADMSSYTGGSGEELILYTCWPPDSIKERYLVHARPIETVAAK